MMKTSTAIQTESQYSDEHNYVLQRGIDSIKDYAIFLLDAHGIVTTWNKGAEHISGYTAPEIIGQPVDCLHKSESLEPHHLQHLLEKAQTQGHCEDEGWRIRKDGSSFWANIIITPIYDEKGTLINFMEVIRDLTERKKAESLLQQSECNYRTLADLSPVGIFHINRERELLYANQRGYEIIGLSAEEAQKTQWLKAIHPDDQVRVFKDWENAHAQNILFRSEFRFLHKDNQEIWVLSIARPIRDEYNQVVRYIQTLVDINERKLLEIKEHERLASIERAEQEQRQRAEVEEANRNRLTNYIDMFTHGLRNPLTGIKGSTLFVQKDIEDIQAVLEKVTQNPLAAKEKIAKYLSDIKEHMESIAACTQHSTLITNDVLNLSQLESHSKELEVNPFRAQAVLTSVAKMYRAAIKEKQLELIVREPEEEILVSGDVHCLEQVLMNLVTNAIKFTSTGNITLSLAVQEVTNSEVVLQFKVEDTGIGMTAEERQHIFKHFEQGNKWISHEYGGSGLGLYLSKQLVQLMGGDITFESEKGKGSTFIFTARCKQLSKEERQDFNRSQTRDNKEEVAPLAGSVALHVLIVEDNMINQKILARHLNTMGYTYQTANNGLEALDLWRSSSFDAILMDIEMPQMNGIDATKAVRQEEKSLTKVPTPIIGLSGNARQEQKEVAIAAGMNDYLIKPYEMGKISQAIEKCVMRKLPMSTATERINPAYSGALFGLKEKQAVTPSTFEIKKSTEKSVKQYQI